MPAWLAGPGHLRRRRPGSTARPRVRSETLDLDPDDAPSRTSASACSCSCPWPSSSISRWPRSRPSRPWSCRRLVAAALAVLVQKIPFTDGGHGHEHGLRRRRTGVEVVDRLLGQAAA
ncbi:MAG: hypothetical protein MZV64_33675 [Ignavibacteriales bacterium]|nr:hypothetical protein [Ignavibacteriales bacterium]